MHGAKAGAPSLQGTKDEEEKDERIGKTERKGEKEKLGEISFQCVGQAPSTLNSGRFQ